jgi:hypothetical protein
VPDDFEGSDFQKWIGYGRKRGWVSRDRRIVDPYKRLTHHGDLDASDIEIAIKGGIASLSGFAGDKYEKRLAREIAEDVLGVTEVNDDSQLKEFGFRSTASPGQQSGQQSDIGKLPTDS